MSRVQNSISWKFEPSGIYSPHSAYMMQFHFHGLELSEDRLLIWSPKASLHAKAFCWLPVHRHCLTADNLAKRQSYSHPSFAKLSSLQHSTGNQFPPPDSWNTVVSRLGASFLVANAITEDSQRWFSQLQAGLESRLSPGCFRRSVMQDFSPHLVAMLIKCLPG